MHTHAHTRTHTDTDTDTDTHTHKPCAVTSTASKQRRVARGPASLSPRFCRFPRAGHWTTRGGLPAPVHWSNNNFGIFSGLGRHLSDCPRGDLIRVGSCFNFTGPTISTVVTFIYPLCRQPLPACWPKFLPLRAWLYNIATTGHNMQTFFCIGLLLQFWIAQDRTPVPNPGMTANQTRITDFFCSHEGEGSCTTTGAGEAINWLSILTKTANSGQPPTMGSGSTITSPTSAAPRYRNEVFNGHASVHFSTVWRGFEDKHTQWTNFPRH